MKSLWELAFLATAADELRRNGNLINYIRSYPQDDITKESELGEAVDGLDWKLEKESKRHKTNNVEANHTDYLCEVMISYSHKDKEIAHKINERLKQDNIKVWIDKEQMHGYMMERMAEAVEQSQCVIICMSSSYRTSLPCKTEANYAYSLEKQLIPIKLQEDCASQGWLAPIARALYTVNFARKPFDDAYKELFEQIERNLSSNRRRRDSDLIKPNTVLVSNVTVPTEEINPKPESSNTVNTSTNNRHTLDQDIGPHSIPTSVNSPTNDNSITRTVTVTNEPTPSSFCTLL